MTHGSKLTNYKIALFLSIKQYGVEQSCLQHIKKIDSVSQKKNWSTVMHQAGRTSKQTHDVDSKLAHRCTDVMYRQWPSNGSTQDQLRAEFVLFPNS